MSLINLFNRSETLVRTTGESYTDDDENLIAGTTINVPIKCNIQPYREGKNSFNQPTGYRTIDAIKVYVPEEFDLFCADEILGLVGDQLTYKGQQYFCKDLERWDAQTYEMVSLIPAHNLGYFYRKDKS